MSEEMGIEPERIDIEPAHRSSDRQFYRVMWRGEHLLTSARPENDACRSLLARGITGKLVTRWARATHDAMALDIERAAQRSVDDGRKGGPRFVNYHEFDRNKDDETP